MSFANMQAHSIDELWELLQASAQKALINFPQLIEAVMLLTGKGDSMAVQDAAAVHQLFLLAMQEGNTPAAAPDIGVLIEFAWTALPAQGQRILRDGKPIESPQDNIAELSTQAVDFITKRLPTLRHLRLLD